MKTCEYCGSHVENGTIICPHCGASKFKVEGVSKPDFPSNNSAYNTYSSVKETQKQYQEQNRNYSYKESKSYGIWTLIFSILIPIVGLIMGIVGVSKYKDGGINKVLSIIAIFIAMLSIFVNGLTGTGSIIGG